MSYPRATIKGEADRCANTDRPLTHSLDYGEEGLAMDATQPDIQHPDWLTECPDRSAWLKRLIPSMGVSEGKCWPWIGALDLEGYGRFPFKTGGRQRFTQAHRAAYLTLVGEIGPDLTVDHLCRNRACINPAHLEPVTNAENVARGADFRRGVPKSAPKPKPARLEIPPLPSTEDRRRDMQEAWARLRLTMR